MKTSKTITNIIMVENFGWAKAFAKGNDYDYEVHMFRS
jgi:hypothetical protein